MNSKIILAKNIDMDRGYKNVLDYSEANLLSLLRSTGHLVAEASDYTFIRGGQPIKTQFSYEQCLKANYIAFQNPDYSNKWFFAWIDEIKYKGNYNTEISYTIDYFSTWFNSITPKQCFVKRHHVNDDFIGNYTLEENIDTGEIVEMERSYATRYTKENGFYVCVLTNYTPTHLTKGTESEDARGRQFNSVEVINSIIYGSQLIIFKIDIPTDILNLHNFLMRMAHDGHSSDIQNMFIAPKCSIDSQTMTAQWAWNLVESDANKFIWYVPPASFSPESFLERIPKNYTWLDFQPKNMKCYCYPYNYLTVSNNSGETKIYKYEDFHTPNDENYCNFANILALSVGCSGKLVPKNYKGSTVNLDEAMTLGKFPNCQWSSDAYTNWLTQNSVNMNTAGVTSVAGIVGALALASTQALPGVGVASAIGLASLYGNTIGNFHKAKLAPDIVGGQATGDVAFSANMIRFDYIFMRSKLESIRVIDDYFSRFGYKINRTIVPNVTGRPVFNYVEIGEQEEIGYGEIPNIARDTINNAFRSGVTIWHNYSYFGDFSQNNAHVTE